MAYSTSNPPVLQSQAIAGPRIWFYQSADAQTDVRVSGYFSNGIDLGMKTGDLVIVTDTDTQAQSLHSVLEANATTGVVDLNDGLAITNTDTD